MLEDRRIGLLTVSTILGPDDQMRVDAAGEGVYVAMHRTRVQDVVDDVRTNKAAAILLSVQNYENGGTPGIAEMVREIPRIPTIALVTDATSGGAKTFLRLGQYGIQHVIDVRSREGWRTLRGVLSHECADQVDEEAQRRLRSVVGSMTAEGWHFFRALFRQSATVRSIRALAEKFDILPSTMMSRFYRAGLPPARQYLALCRLVRAAHLFENGAFSIANVATHLEYSSPQSFARHIQIVMHMRAGEFRRRYSGASMFDLFERKLLIPYVKILQTFDPLSTRVPMKSKVKSEERT